MHAAPDPAAPEFTRQYQNLADPRLGTEVIAVSDDFFAPGARMLDPQPAVFLPGKYDEHGKWMDGWESRRKRGPGNDWLVLRLGHRARLHGVDIDTSHFTGNFPPAASLEGCDHDSDPGPDTRWRTLLPSVSLQGNSHHYHGLSSEIPCTHIRLQIYPDGGIARLRLYGRVERDWVNLAADTLVDLIAAENGGQVLSANNQHFGPAATLLLPGRGVTMGDGWETRRRREPGNDWCIIALGHPGIVERVEVDTAHFKGNYPEHCGLLGALVRGGTDASIATQSMFWPELLGPQPLQMDHIHSFAVTPGGPVTHVRFNIFPDGGVSRLRLWGRVAHLRGLA
jgi:allantoicase